jgi:predicted phosphodiesterase
MEIEKKKIFEIIGLWVIFALMITAGIMAVVQYESEVISYVIYYIIGLILTAVVFGFTTKSILKKENVKIQIRVPLVIWIILILASSMFGIIYLTPPLAARNFSTKPYLNWIGGQNTSTSIIVSWVTSSETTGEVSYGISQTSLDTIVAGDSVPTKYHQILLTGLSPNTTYYYKTSASSEIFHFTTAPVGLFNYSFSAWSDHRTNSPVQTSIWQYNQPNVVEHIYKAFQEMGKTNAFSICSGDIASVAKDMLGWKTWFNDISYQNWGSNAPVQVIFGNHERYDDPEYKMVQQFYPYTKQADNRFFYSFDYGGVHFIMLDPYNKGHSWAQNFTDTQLNWLQNDLEANKNAPYTLIFMHPNPVRLSGVKASLDLLCQQYDIDMIFCGHHHEFQVESINKTKVVTLGLGGNQNNDFAAFECDTAFGYFDVTITNLTFTAQFINGTKLTTLTFPM